jgi:hypothetical protein
VHVLHRCRKAVSLLRLLTRVAAQLHVQLCQSVRVYRTSSNAVCLCHVLLLQLLLLADCNIGCSSMLNNHGRLSV